MFGRLHLATTVMVLSMTSCGSDVGSDAPIQGGGGDNPVTMTGAAGGTAGAGGANFVDASIEARADATGDASESGSTDPTDEASEAVAELLADKSPDCWACAQGPCANQITACATQSGAAKAGPAAGERKSTLCVETLACVLQTGCAASDLAACYCGVPHPDPDFNCDYDSACSRTLERSLETTDRLAVLVSLTDPSKAGGWAMALMQCLRDNQCTACLTTAPGEGGADGGDLDADVPDSESTTARVATQKSRNRHTQPLIERPHHGNR